MEDLEIWCVRRGFHRTAKHVGGPRQQVLLLFCDLGGMHAKLCRQLRQRLLAFDRGEGHLRLEGRPVIASRSLHRLAPLVRPPSGASVTQGYHLAHCPNFWGPLSRVGFRKRFPKPLVRHLDRQSNSLNFKAEERAQRRLDRLLFTARIVSLTRDVRDRRDERDGLKGEGLVVSQLLTSK